MIYIIYAYHIYTYCLEKNNSSKKSKKEKSDCNVPVVK